MAPPTVKSHWSIILHTNHQKDGLRLSHKLCSVLTDRLRVAGKREGWCVLWNDLFGSQLRHLPWPTRLWCLGVWLCRGRPTALPPSCTPHLGSPTASSQTAAGCLKRPMLRSGTNRHHIQTADADNNLESATITERLLACYQTLSLSLTVVFLVALSSQLQYSCGNERLWVLLAPLFGVLLLLKERKIISERFNKSTPRTAGCFLVVLWFNIKDEGWG